MTALSPLLIRWRLAQLAAHIVVILIALVVVGGATRVMEAGLACPDWPLCFGSLLPGRQMNVQVFLEWFHRLDAFVVGIALAVQMCLAWLWRSQLPKWLPWAYASILVLVALQGAVGALTVLDLLPAGVVTTHLFFALTLVASMSAIAQRLLSPNGMPSPLWWRFWAGGSLVAVMTQCLLGGRMATTWSAQICLSQGHDCQLLNLHRLSAIPVALSISILFGTSLFVGGWARSKWPTLISVFLLLIAQIMLGMLSVHLALSEPLLTVCHQLIAALLVALLSALSFQRPNTFGSHLGEIAQEKIVEPCHG